MTHFVTYAAMLAASNPIRHRGGWTSCDSRYAPDTWACEECSAVSEFLPREHNGGTGYTITSDGRMICYGCAHKRDIEALKDRSRPFVTYMSSDGRSISNWPGGILGRVIRSRTGRLSRWSFTHGRTIQHVRVVDVHGGHWFGCSNPGIAIVLRPCKGGR